MSLLSGRGGGNLHQEPGSSSQTDVIDQKQQRRSQRAGRLLLPSTGPPAGGGSCAHSVPGREMLSSPPDPGEGKPRGLKAPRKPEALLKFPPATELHV